MKRTLSLLLLSSLVGLGACASLLPALAPQVEAEENIDDSFPYESKFIKIFGSNMHYVEEGEGEPILLLHGNPTSNYLWRNVIPHLTPHGRVIAPDNIGMGKSDKPDIDYTLADHVRYMKAFIEAMDLKNVLLVVHDWGGGIGFDYAMRHQENIRAIALMETVVKPMSLKPMDPGTRYLMGQLRDPEAGRKLIVDENYFIEKIVPMYAGRDLTEKEMAAYRAPYLEPEHRKPILVWPSEVPFDGHPVHNHRRVGQTYELLKASDIPLLLLSAQPGAVMTDELVAELKRDLPRMKTQDIGPGLHFLQESQPTAIGEALSKWIVGEGLGALPENVKQNTAALPANKEAENDDG
jgi:haloalkane dehalogenase